MRIALYIDSNVYQVVLTPELPEEKELLKLIDEKKITMKYFTGAFYPCQGGWTRHSDYEDEKSFIIVLEKK